MLPMSRKEVCLNVEVQMHVMFARAITGGANPNPNNNYRQVKYLEVAPLQIESIAFITLFTGLPFEQSSGRPVIPNCGLSVRQSNCLGSPSRNVPK
jgi:hypothetical protein